MTNLSASFSFAPSAPVFMRIGSCFCCGCAIYMGERYHFDAHRRLRCADHAPSIASQFWEVVAALHTASHPIWSDPETVRDALVDADVLRSQLSEAKRFFAFKNGKAKAEFLHRIERIKDSTQRDLWVQAFASELEAFRELANALADRKPVSDY